MEALKKQSRLVSPLGQPFKNILEICNLMHSSSLTPHVCILKGNWDFCAQA